MCRQTNARGEHVLSKGERFLSDLCLSTRETSVLQISRCFFQSFALPASQGWLQAHRIASAELPEALGPRVLCATLDMVQGLRVSRRSIFRFSNPYCAACARILTPHERFMMATLGACIAGCPEEARGHATLLCEGNSMEEFLDRSARLAEHLSQPVAVA